MSVPPPSPLNLLFHVDSGAGQSMRSCPDAFLSLPSCAIEVIGVSGSLPIFGTGTAMFVIRTADDRLVVGLIHNCLLSQGSPFNLQSVSQFQSSLLNSVDFSVGSPQLSVQSSFGHAICPLDLHGLYSFSAEPIHPSDDRYRFLPRFDFTPRDGVFSSRPSTHSVVGGVSHDAASPLGEWSCRLFAGTTAQQRILAFPLTGSSDFDSELRNFCDGFSCRVTTSPPHL